MRTDGRGGQVARTAPRLLAMEDPALGEAIADPALVGVAHARQMVRELSLFIRPAAFPDALGRQARVVSRSFELDFGARMERRPTQGIQHRPALVPELHPALRADHAARRGIVDLVLGPDVRVGR